MSDTYEIEIPTLSTGEPSTLGNWYKLTKAFFGEDSGATKFWMERILESEREGNGGVEEGVIADEGQCMYLNFQFHQQGKE